ncbi:MAG: hypothetical protein LPK09_03800, partial [Hymenobacteraceae bacterium]|nr:hypothetical protein [Hymenobacteraceae bacterium]
MPPLYKLKFSCLAPTLWLLLLPLGLQAQQKYATELQRQRAAKMAPHLQHILQSDSRASYR